MIEPLTKKEIDPSLQQWKDLRIDEVDPALSASHTKSFQVSGYWHLPGLCAEGEWPRAYAYYATKEEAEACLQALRTVGFYRR